MVGWGQFYCRVSRKEESVDSRVSKGGANLMGEALKLALANDKGGDHAHASLYVRSKPTRTNRNWMASPPALHY